MSAQPRRTFYIGMSAAMTVTVLAGFGPTYYLKPIVAAPALPLSVHIHGALFTAWILLFTAQTFLVAKHRVDVHRRLGVAGAILIVAMIVSGVRLAVDFARIPAPATAAALAGASRLFVLVIPLTSILLFAIFAGLGLWYRRNGGVHKRLMLLATIALLPPALGRIRLLAVAGPYAFFTVTVIFLVAAVVYDLSAQRRVHAVSLWGGLFLALSFPARIALGHTASWDQFARWLVR